MSVDHSKDHSRRVKTSKGDVRENERASERERAKLYLRYTVLERLDRTKVESSVLSLL